MYFIENHLNFSEVKLYEKLFVQKLRQGQIENTFQKLQPFEQP